MVAEKDIHAKLVGDPQWVEVAPGRWVKLAAETREAHAAVTRKRDSKHFHSYNLAPSRGQLSEWNKLFGGPGSGVKFKLDQNGVPVAEFADRNAKLRHMRQRSGQTRLVDFDEVRG